MSALEEDKESVIEPQAHVIKGRDKVRGGGEIPV